MSKIVNIYDGVLANDNLPRSIRIAIDDFSNNLTDRIDSHAKASAHNPIRVKLYNGNYSTWRFVSSIEEAREVYRFLKNLDLDGMLFELGEKSCKHRFFNKNTENLEILGR